MELIAFALAAVFVEGVIEYFVADRIPSKYLRYAALGLAILFAVAYDLDLLRAAFGLPAKWALVGNVVTAFIVSRGSNYLNDFITALKQKSDIIAKSE